MGNLFNSDSPLLQTANKVAEGIAIQAVKYGKEKLKNDVIFGNEKKLFTNKPLLQQKTNEVLGTETILSSASVPKKNLTSQVLLIESQLMQQALQVPTPATLPPLWLRQQTEDYYKSVKIHSDSKKAVGDASLKLQNDIIKEYYDKLVGLSQLYAKDITADGVQNAKLTRDYYAGISAVAEENHGYVYDNGFQKLVNNTIVWTQIYYGVVRGLSLLFKTWMESSENKNKSKVTDYYKNLKSFEKIKGEGLPNGYNIIATKDVYDTSGEKSVALKDRADIVESSFFKKNRDGKYNFWEGNPEYKRWKEDILNQEKYVKLVEYVQEQIIKFYDTSAEGLKIKADAGEVLPDTLSKLQQAEKKKWEQYHSHDEMSKEMKASLLAYMKVKGIDTGKIGTEAADIKNVIMTEAIKGNNIFELDNMPITEAGKTYGPAADLMEQQTYTIKAEGKRPEQVLKKGLTVITSAGAVSQQFVTSPQIPYSKQLADILKETRADAAGAYRFFFEKLHGKKADGSGFYKRNPITPGKKFEDMENRMVFPAYIDNFNDAYDVNWSNYDFYGRSESVWIYKNTNRSLTINFFMLSDFSAEILIERIKKTNQANPIAQNATSDEVVKSLNNFFIDWGNGSYDLPRVVENTGGEHELLGWIPGQYSGTSEQMWARMTFLAQCCYPWYRRDGKLKEQPLVRIRIGDFIDLVIKIKSLTFDEYEEFNIDLNSDSKVGAYPMGVRCALTADVIHSEEPSSNYAKFYWRKDFDVDPAPPVEQQKAATPTPKATTPAPKAATPAKPVTQPIIPIKAPVQQGGLDWKAGGGLNNYQVPDWKIKQYEQDVKNRTGGVKLKSSNGANELLNGKKKTQDAAKKDL